jgi:23S rRNA G2069 N7-methylase RlmK/C1962 C5-methylase RlmI
MMWLDKKNPNTIYIDIRKEVEGFDKHRHRFNIQPDIVADFRNLPFPDKTFKLIVWDPPHMIRPDGQKALTGILVKKYGALTAITWKSDLRRGFNELWRCLDVNGTLVFKFCDREIQFDEVLKCFHTQPLFGTVTKKNDYGETKWFTFFKAPKR